MLSDVNLSRAEIIESVAISIDLVRSFSIRIDLDRSRAIALLLASIKQVRNNGDTQWSLSP